MAIDWYDIKFLESASNLREVVQRSSSRSPSAGRAREVCVCLQQGRLYFEAAATAPIQIKPLLIYYGVVAFAQAVTVVRSNNALATLTPSHGLKDVTRHGGTLEELTVRCDTAGTFQEFNNAIAPMARFWHYENFMLRWFAKPFDLSNGLQGKEISIIEILSRIPALSQKFSQTFSLPANALVVQIMSDTFGIGGYQLRIDDPELYRDRQGLIATVRKWRSKYPFLNGWRFIEASHAWDNAILLFDNVDKAGADDLAEDWFINAGNCSFTTAMAVGSQPMTFLHVPDMIPALSGGYGRSGITSAMRPIFNVNLPEYSWQFLGAFLLSSLVRYRPQIWQSAISRSFTDRDPANDRSLALIERFLDDVLNTYPIMVVSIIDNKSAEQAV